MRRLRKIWPIVTILIIAFFFIPSKISRKSADFLSSASMPIMEDLSHFGRKVASFFSIFSEISTLRADNQRLSEELVGSKVDSSHLAELETENQRLKEQLEFKNSNQDKKLVLSSVVGIDPTNFYDSVIINRGSNDGLNSGMAVISLGTLVGKINQVSPQTSTVSLVKSKDSIVQVMLEKSRTTGILKGGISGMTLENIPLDTQVAEGENVITSGLGGKLPKGIFVGTIGKEISAKSDIFKSIEVRSPIDFNKLEILFVIK